ncbi:hypothetical protein [Marinobacter zhejiangensis]|uniref:Uncharacterized protein n=1 Tax=Marinobacter zhejiangensis TaxID=488535 RepID=A0A1I4RQT1_9GAMM|nr:hypothetical protein [Marinobacter zhejiangensis]SFM54568.1 hypothetical protein SAMN04487963_2896 [Marinobacter zhejiangensis]
MLDISSYRLRLLLRAVAIAAIAVAALNGCASSAVNPGAASQAAIPAVTEQRTWVPEPVEPLDEAQSQLLDSAEGALASENWVMAAERLEALANARPDYALAKARLAWVKERQGDIPAAKALYREALEQRPDDVVSVNNLALLMQREGGFGEARGLLEQGLKYSPEVPELHFNLAVLSELYLLDLETALAHYRRYQELSEDENARVAGWIADLERRVQ